jgi:hypothetical protein
MRTAIFACIALTLATAALAAPATPFPRSISDATRAAAQLERGFRHDLPPLEVAAKAGVLAPLVDGAGHDLVATLETAVPPPAYARCHADALDGARRAVASMNDMIQLYRQSAHEAAFVARITASARTADQGLQALDQALQQCAGPAPRLP